MLNSRNWVWYCCVHHNAMFTLCLSVLVRAVTSYAGLLWTLLSFVYVSLTVSITGWYFSLSLTHSLRKVCALHLDIFSDRQIFLLFPEAWELINERTAPLWSDSVPTNCTVVSTNFTWCYKTSHVTKTFLSFENVTVLYSLAADRLSRQPALGKVATAVIPTILPDIWPLKLDDSKNKSFIWHFPFIFSLLYLLPANNAVVHLNHYKV